MITKKKEILDFFKDLRFNEEYHHYFVNGKQIKLSVSGIIKKFVVPFDTKKVSKIVSLKRGISQTEVLKEWEEIKNKACNQGTEVHLFGELYPFNRNLKPTNGFEEAIVNFWNDLPPYVIPVFVELKMYHKEYMFAGTADIILYNTITNTYSIGDYKTNKDLFKNYRKQKMLKPFDDLLDCPYNKYQLQLSFYQILFEQLGFKVSSRKIIWLRPNGRYKLYDTKDYTNILKDYLKNNEL